MWLASLRPSTGIDARKEHSLGEVIYFSSWDFLCFLLAVKENDMSGRQPSPFSRKGTGYWLTKVMPEAASLRLGRKCYHKVYSGKYREIDRQSLNSQVKSTIETKPLTCPSAQTSRKEPVFL